MQASLHATVARFPSSSFLGDFHRLSRSETSYYVPNSDQQYSLLQASPAVCSAMHTTACQHQQLLPPILLLLSELMLHHSLFLCAGQLVVFLFVFINKLNYSNSCLSSIFYVGASVLVAQDAHVGSKMNAAAFVIGPLWFGIILAGCMVCQHVS